MRGGILRGISDHSPIWVKLALVPDGLYHRRLGWLHPFWMIGPSPLGELKEFFQMNVQTASRACIWDAMKAFIRGVYMKFASENLKIGN